MIKKGFTFFELLVVLMLLGTFYALFFANFSKESVLKEQNQWVHLKSELLKKFTYKKSLQLVCIKDEFQCFVIIDGNKVQKKEYDLDLDDTVEVFTYSEKLQNQYFPMIEFENLQIEEVLFELKFSSNNRSNEFVVKTSHGVYVFSAFEKNALVFESLNQVQEYFQSMIDEVKDAF